MTGTSLQIRTFESLTITRDDAVIEGFLTQKTALLFVYLAMNPGEHTREKLAALLWSETTDEQALKNLRTVLSSLRKTIPDGVRITRRAVQVADAVWVDAHTFERICDVVFAGESVLLDALIEIANLYRGEFLGDVPIRQAESLAAWVNRRRDELQHKHGLLLYHIAEQCIESGQFHIGIDIARKLVILNPLWEAAHRRLMTLLVYLDQGGEAQMQYERLVKLLETELGAHPEPETIALYESIRSGALQSPRRPGARAIILPDLPYIPPRKEVAYLTDLLNDPNCRLISVIGMGGVGKSMLATFIAHEHQHRYRSGVTIVPLTTVPDAAALPQAILSAMNVTVKGKASEAQVLSELADLQMLLVLDNYEHLLPETALIARILESAPEVKVLVTSQLPLNLRQEWPLTLTGLEVNQSADNDAVQLFKITAQRILPNFDVRHYPQDITAICQFLEGLPLGIVIAAGQLKYLSPPQILARLREDLLAVRVQYQDMPARHQSFESLVKAMLGHLSPQDQQALMALSIFRGSFGHEAALQVAEIDMATFISLVDKSLVQRVENFRYTIHGLLRRFFAAQLEHSPERDLIRQRLTAYYQQWCHDLYRQKPSLLYDMPRIDAEHANIWHLDLLTGLEQQRYLLEIIPALQNYWLDRGFSEIITEWVRRAAENPIHPAPLRARGMIELAAMAIEQGKQALTQELCERGMAIAPDHLYVKVYAMQAMGRIAMQRGDYKEAWAIFEQVLELEAHSDQSDDPQIDMLFTSNHNAMGSVAAQMGEIELARMHYHIAMHNWMQRNEEKLVMHVRSNLGVVDLRTGSYEAARDHFEAIIPIAQSSRNNMMIMIANANLGYVLMLMGDFSGAHHSLSQAIAIALRIKRRASALYQLETFTNLAYLMKQYPVAVQLHGFNLKAREQEGIAFSAATLQQIAVYSAQMKEALGDNYERLLNLGQKMSLEAAVALARSLSLYLEPYGAERSL